MLSLFKIFIMRKAFLLLFFLNVAAMCLSQNATTIARPKLVVGIVIDQMRWDYLYRFYDLYKPDGGFKRFLNEGFSCENTFISYTPTYTAAGHSCVYTGTVPAINGIVGNNWHDNILDRDFYCTDDATVKTVGSNSAAGIMSPRNMLSTTIGDELRLATNFKSKVIGIAIKDRASILPAGHDPTAAYWYDYSTGNFITSTYYMNALPDWVNDFNKRKVVDSLYKLNWLLSLPRDVYSKYSTKDEEPFEFKTFGDDQAGFPYNLLKYVGNNYSAITSTPHGNTLTEEMAEQAIVNENLGKNNTTDMLTVSFSSPDYIGHAFGPNSWEEMDNYIRLDETLGRFFNFLDAAVGKGDYTIFLTADHGVAHVPNFSIENRLPGGAFNDIQLAQQINATLYAKYGVDKLVTGIYNFQLVVKNALIDSSKLPKEEIYNWIISYLQQQPEIAQAFKENSVSSATLPAKQKEMFANGYYPSRCGDIAFILKPGYVEGNGIGTSHGLWNPYDSHIPLLWYGWGIKHGQTNRETYMTDIAATIAAMLHIQMPSGCIGKVIEEVSK